MSELEHISEVDIEKAMEWDHRHNLAKLEAQAEAAQIRESIGANMTTFFKAAIQVEKAPFVCPLCGDSREYTVEDRVFQRQRWETPTHSSVYTRQRCTCEQEAHDKEIDRRKQEELEHERRRIVDECRDHCRLVGKLSRMTLDNVEAKPGLEKAIKAAQEVIEIDDKKSLMLTGAFGSGKTHIAAAIGNALVNKGISVQFWAGFDILEDIRQSYDSHAYSDEDLCDKLGQVAVLIYDDLGNERIASDERGEWAREKLFRIFYHREIRELPVIITTNYDVKELHAKLGGATVSRILGMCGKPIAITAPDYRLKHTEGGVK